MLPSSTDYQAICIHKAANIIAVPHQGYKWRLRKSIQLPPECMNTLPLADPEPVLLQNKPR